MSRSSYNPPYDPKSLIADQMMMLRGAKRSTNKYDGGSINIRVVCFIYFPYEIRVKKKLAVQSPPKPTVANGDFFFCVRSVVIVVVVFFTLTDRALTISSNIRGCQSGTWSAGQKEIRGTSTKLQ